MYEDWKKQPYCYLFENDCHFNERSIINIIKERKKNRASRWHYTVHEVER